MTPVGTKASLKDRFYFQNPGSRIPDLMPFSLLEFEQQQMTVRGGVVLVFD